MTINPGGKLIGFFVAVLLLVPSVSSQQGSRASGSAVKSSPENAPVLKLEVDDPLNGFTENGLPPFSAFSELDTDGAAAAAAEAISRFDDDSWPALLGALRKAGFTIMDRERRTLIAPESIPGNGMAFYDWETNGMLKLARKGFGTTLEGWMAKGAAGGSSTESARLAEALLSDLKKQAQNRDDQQKRFWARLIIELGKSGEKSMDLTTVPASGARIDALQLGIWERRLTGDLLAYLANTTAGRNASPKSDFIRKVSYAVSSNSRPVAPCELNNEQGLIVDAAANVLGAAHGEFLGLLEKGFGAGSKGAEAVGKVSAGLSAVNLALAWGKLVAAHMVIKGEASVESPLPLVRTVNSTPGQQRLMKARIWADVGDLQFLNCVRTAINVSTGLDFSLPSDGPLSDRDAAWELTGAASFSGQQASKTGVYKPFVHLKPPEGAKRNADEQVTDANGETKMYLEGSPKVPAVAYFKAVKVKKIAPVRVSVALKSPRDTAQNLIDIGGAALGVALGGPTGILSALPELGFRMKRPAASLKVPVEDREPCEERWMGTIEFTKKSSKTERSGSGTKTVEDFESVEYLINGKQPSKRPKMEEENETNAELADSMWEMLTETGSVVGALASVSVKHVERYEGMFDPDPCCGPDHPGGGRGSQSHEISGNLLRDVLVTFVFDGQNVHFNLEPAFSSLMFDGIQRDFRSLPESKCPYERSGDGAVVKPVKITPLVGQNYVIKLAPKVAGGIETLSGSETKPFENGEITITWDLSRCG
ncbi:MAG: hypothetical protein OEM82_03465 [Acidobacteriota bacterium]|nr:hypothetical protein [Acidobacteriota bacterium]MDH3528161.1 hypothetical protein [Acidobacteriota bacterium]